jgi:hypothetical protein
MLVAWLHSNLTDVQSMDNQDEQVRQMAEVITIVAIGRQKNEEEANQLIKLPQHDKFGGGTSNEFYLLLAPLLYWLEYAIDSDDRYPLFMQVYQTIKEVLMGLPRS